MAHKASISCVIVFLAAVSWNLLPLEVERLNPFWKDVKPNSLNGWKSSLAEVEQSSLKFGQRGQSREAKSVPCPAEHPVKAI